MGALSKFQCPFSKCRPDPELGGTLFREVKRNHIGCLPGDSGLAGVALFVLSSIGASTNGLLPLLDKKELFMPWLAMNDALLCATVIAAIVTMTTESAVAEVKEKLAQPGKLLVDTGETLPLDEWTYKCERCEINAPFRTGHCLKCQKCVEQYDHHNSLLGVCIGKSNKRAFVTALILALSYLSSSLAMSLTTICMVSGFELDVHMMEKDAWTVMMAMTSLLIACPMADLMRRAYWQIRARYMEVTQYELFTLLGEKREEADRKAEAKKAAEKAEKAKKLAAKVELMNEDERQAYKNKEAESEAQRKAKANKAVTKAIAKATAKVAKEEEQAAQAAEKKEKDDRKAQEKAEKDALKADDKAEKDARKAKEKEAKDAEKAKKKAENDAAKEDEKLDKEFKDAVKAERKAGRELLKAMSKVEKTVTEISKHVPKDAAKGEKEVSNAVVEKEVSKAVLEKDVSKAVVEKDVSKIMVEKDAAVVGNNEKKMADEATQQQLDRAKKRLKAYKHDKAAVKAGPGQHADPTAEELRQHVRNGRIAKRTARHKAKREATELAIQNEVNEELKAEQALREAQERHSCNAVRALNARKTTGLFEAKSYWAQLSKIHLEAGACGGSVQESDEAKRLESLPGHVIIDMDDEDSLEKAVPLK